MARGIFYMKRVFLTVGLTLAAVLIIWYGVRPVLEKHSPPITIPEITTATILKPKRLITDFALTDTSGKPFTEKSLLGQWTLMFFGYAQCPEICPKTLATMTELWKQVPMGLRFVFVSLDPKSDTVQNLSDFLGRFNPNFIGLTGEEAVVERLGKASGIYSWQDPNANKNDPSTPKIIDHSATLLLINPQGRLHAVFTPPYQAEPMAKDLQQILSSAIPNR
jgi:protein SCO1/2